MRDEVVQYRRMRNGVLAQTPPPVPQAGSEVLQRLAGPQRVYASRHKGHRACQQAAHRTDPSEAGGPNAARNPRRRIAAGDEAGERAPAFRLECGDPQREPAEAVGDDDPGLRVLGRCARGTEPSTGAVFCAGALRAGRIHPRRPGSGTARPRRSALAPGRSNTE